MHYKVWDNAIMTLGLGKEFLGNKIVLIIKEMLNVLKFSIVKTIRNQGGKVTFLGKIFASI